jgi:hypothetical protein
LFLLYLKTSANARGKARLRRGRWKNDLAVVFLDSDSGVLHVNTLPENGGVNDRSGDFFAEHLSADVTVI